MKPSLTKRFHNFMQSVKSREDGKPLPEHFNSMISIVLSKRDMEEEKFQGNYKVSRNQPILLPWGGGVGQKNQKAL